MIQIYEERDKNKKLLDQLNNEQKIVKELKEKIILYENKNNIIQEKIIELEEIINSQNLKTKKQQNIKNKITTINSGEEIISICFTSVNEDIHRPISCKNTDTFVKIEEKIYNEYPKYKDYNTYLTVNGNIIKKFKTIDENGIKDGNTIIINLYDE